MGVSDDELERWVRSATIGQLVAEIRELRASRCSCDGAHYCESEVADLAAALRDERADAQLDAEGWRRAAEAAEARVAELEAERKSVADMLTWAESPVAHDGEILTRAERIRYVHLRGRDRHIERDEAYARVADLEVQVRRLRIDQVNDALREARGGHLCTHESVDTFGSGAGRRVDVCMTCETVLRFWTEDPAPRGPRCPAAGPGPFPRGLTCLLTAGHRGAHQDPDGSRWTDHG